MNYIVLDLEYNQAFDFTNGIKCEPEEGCPFEIIQIGAIKLNSKFEYEDEFNILIKPKIYTRVHPYVEKITSLSDKILSNGDDFSNAANKFMAFCGKDYIFCTWGSGDIKELWKNMVYYNMNYEFKKFRFINIQLLASKQLKRNPGITIGLKNAVISFDIEIDRAFHDALNDAYYTSKVLKLIQKKSLTVQNFNYKKAVGKTNKKLEFTNFTKLYEIVEKELGRKITPKEKKLFRQIYIMGKNGQFDLLRN